MPLSRVQADGLLLLVAVIWGSAFVAQSWGMEKIRPLAFTGVRFLIGALVVLPLALVDGITCARGNRRCEMRAADHGRIALLGVLLCAGAVMQQVGIMADRQGAGESYCRCLCVNLSNT
ncbi:MAG: DMT family transporter [Comamonadaceae bacterium]|nr:DMT family transporter [Comamonadaceae bacterium]